ncbi:hypothetical protein XO10_10035 [Marinitoga sp. 1135]|uniref:Putative phosphoesterase, ICC n=1 Tax=Marinitoga piezophila (strain DSM 14283 / JCM 11233 / KA3) TaxID=443254 RepID=H2J741_MARPK|nr:MULTISPECIES: metallophosphoesterase [Marinitoga]AEX86411.1 putative phosphoesterase, ICC [Marinitoga piezophila KA3]APT76801.1 hypothetical protein LN42_10755 [Marinitoga sp. 1137]NUU96569.1 hypothetical protein [Marinitoga sp. 1135]
MIEIVAVSDEEKGSIHKIIKKCDILLGCGDLSPGYFDFLLNTLTPKISLMIYGNHDKKYFKKFEDINLNDFSNIYTGIKVIHNEIINIKSALNISEDVYITGFSGALSYGKKPFHFKEKDARAFCHKLNRSKFLNRFKKLDVIISHSPPGISNIFDDMDDYHKGSKQLAKIYLKYFPKIWFYGHIHPRYTSKPLNFKIYYKGRISYLLNTVPFKYVLYDENLHDIVKIKGENGRIKLKEIYL